MIKIALVNMILSYKIKFQTFNFDKNLTLEGAVLRNATISHIHKIMSILNIEYDD